MPDVYKVKTHSGQFAAFWAADECTLILFRPSDLWEQYRQCDLAEWKALREGYDTKEHKLGSYNETINAAWHFLAVSNQYIDKSHVELSSIEPGKYYPRVWRGFISGPGLGTYCAVEPRNEYGAKHAQSVTAASSLFEYLVEIFRHIEPCATNLDAFGHKIRELLILICTEIESSWRAILVDNGYTSRTRFSTNDYVKLIPVLRLKDWKVTLKEYPSVEAFAPFENWDSTAPTESLGWYNAYNAVKHDRETAFSQATLKNLLDAAAALHIMQAAQWGPDIFSIMHDNRFSPFLITYIPNFRIAEIYMAPLEQGAALAPIQFFNDL